MHVLGETHHEAMLEFGERGLGGEVPGKGARRLLAGDLAGPEDPEHGFGAHGGAGFGGLGEEGLAFGYRFAVKGYAGVGVEDGGLPEHGFEAAGGAMLVFSKIGWNCGSSLERIYSPHAANGILHLDFAEDFAALGLDFCEKLLFGGDCASKGFFEVGLRGRG